MHRSVSMLLMVVFLVLALLPIALPAAGADAERQGRVNADKLNVRNGPGTTNSVVASVSSGEMLVILGGEGDWLKVQLGDGTIGWVAGKFIEEITPPAEAGTKAAPEKKHEAKEAVTRPAHATAGGGGGGSAIGTIFKWGCLVGAGAVGYLAYNEHTQGNDAYDAYKADVTLHGITPIMAEPKRKDAQDHDSKSVTYQIVAGSLFGAFVVQQFMMGHHGGDTGEMIQDRPPALPLTWNPLTGELRASLVLARF
jgi:hypothetical protein